MRNPAVYLFWSAQMATLIMVVWFALFAENKSGFVMAALGGMAAFVVLIPLHEWLHGVGYKWAGAPLVEYRMNRRQFVFYAIADRFVTRKRPFVLLALAPFIIINSLLVLLIALLPSGWTPWLCGALFMHVAGCSGDFALISYFITHWDKDPVTFDDAEGGETHFFIRQRS